MSFDADKVRHAYEGVIDGYADAFGDGLERSAFDRSVLDDAIASLPATALLVDLGCGPGQIACYLSAHGRRAFGLDLTPAMLKIARRRHNDLPLIGADLLYLPLRAGTVDGVVAWYSLHNLPRVLLSDALTEARRVLRGGGVFLVSTHVGEGEEWVEHDWHGEAEQVVITYYEPEELVALVNDHGFAVCDIRSRLPLDHERPVTKLFVVATAE